MSDSKIKSADNLIVQEEAIKLGKPIPETKEKEHLKSKEEQEIVSKEEILHEENGENGDEAKEITEDKSEDSEEQLDNSSQEESQSDDTDEYGTKVGKKKLYTEEEVQRMIRERLSRGRNAQEVQEAAKEFTPNLESSEDWETQLENFVEQTITKREQKLRDSEWKQHEEKVQAEFEDKFTTGMQKYNDFQKVVSNKPITNAMMLATRNMNDPAAFIYAASKQHPKELERIAKIQDPLTQGVEMGRLEERMKKTRNLPSSPKPAKLISGDASDALPQLGIDARIAQHAKSKVIDRRK
jgi:hypothetical protein